MRSALLFPALVVSTPALADVPRVATDILPVHSLVARVMEGVGTPDLVLPPGASPHGFSMRPTQAAAIENAEIVFWIGDALTPWLSEPLEVLAGDALHVALLEADGTRLIETSEDDHGHGEDKDHDDHDDHDDHADHKDEHDHADHDDHKDDHAKHDDHDGHDDHDDHAKHDDHDGHDDHAKHDDHDDHAGHDHGPIDPHAWLDPANAAVWLALIADTLSDADPDNAATYQANAKAGIGALASLGQDMTANVAGLQDKPFAVYHEAYAYLGQATGVEPNFSLADTDADLPTPRRIATLRERAIDENVTVVFVEPGTNPSLIDTAFEGVSVTTCEVDPLGGNLPAGPNQYWQSLLQISQIMAECGAN